jgi:beta-alanine--pyruvate transaminase
MRAGNLVGCDWLVAAESREKIAAKHHQANLIIAPWSNTMLQKISAPHEQSALWMPFTANRQFKSSPRMLVSAEGMHYQSHDGRQILDGTAGLWCVNAGHGRAEIADALAAQSRTLDFAPGFQMGHPHAFEAAERLAQITPAGLDRVFFTNSGSESVDTALKIALAFHRANGQPQRTVFIGRERGYHGKAFRGSMLGNVDHLSHTLDIKTSAFSRGQPEHGADLALQLESLVTLHDAQNIAAVIVEPVAGSTGVLIPPKGYLTKLREICDKHGILLIFDEVITGFGRLGTPFASQFFDVTPDILTLAKGINNAAVPMGAVVAKTAIYDVITQSAAAGAIEFFHGYTYSGHPLACAAACATFDIYEREGLLTRAAELAQHWEDALHSLREHPHVIDIRNLGLIGGIELQARPGAAGTRAFDVFTDCFEQGLLIRTTGDVIAMSPPLIASKAQLTEMVSTVGKALHRVK